MGMTTLLIITPPTDTPPRPPRVQRASRAPLTAAHAVLQSHHDLETGTTSTWTVAIVPAATRLQLAERHDHRLCGLVLLENEDTRLIDTNDCIAILCNLANALGNKRAAERARAVPRSTSTSHDWATDEHTIDDLPSFGTGIHDRGLTAADCFPHVRQALQSKH